MFTYYMHTRREGEIIHVDEDGYRRSALESMRAEAFHGARSLMAHSITKGRAPELQNSFEITDELGALLLTVRFADTLDGSMPPLERRLSWD
ncbi:MAG: hypothetical protein JWN93_1918 [Hyphomicrobiales bacterium]|nr:hypothetical protein [Hyphomicrobiales bacterium]